MCWFHGGGAGVPSSWVSNFTFWKGLGEHPAASLVTYHVFTYPIAIFPSTLDSHVFLNQVYSTLQHTQQHDAILTPFPHSALPPCAPLSIASDVPWLTPLSTLPFATPAVMFLCQVYRTLQQQLPVIIPVMMGVVAVTGPEESAVPPLVTQHYIDVRQCQVKTMTFLVNFMKLQPDLIKPHVQVRLAGRGYLGVKGHLGVDKRLGKGRDPGDELRPGTWRGWLWLSSPAGCMQAAHHCLWPHPKVCSNALVHLLKFFPLFCLLIKLPSFNSSYLGLGF